MAQIETNEDRSSLSHSQMEPGNNDRKREKKRERAGGGGNPVWMFCICRYRHLDPHRKLV